MLLPETQRYNASRTRPRWIRCKHSAIRPEDESMRTYSSSSKGPNRANTHQKAVENTATPTTLKARSRTQRHQGAVTHQDAWERLAQCPQLLRSISQLFDITMGQRVPNTSRLANRRTQTRSRLPAPKQCSRWLATSTGVPNCSELGSRAAIVFFSTLTQALPSRLRPRTSLARGQHLRVRHPWASCRPLRWPP